MSPSLFSFTNNLSHRTEVEVDKASTGEFSCPPLAGVQTADGVTEGLLVVVKPQPGRVELPANIHDESAGGQDGRVPGPHDLRLLVPRQHPQEGAGQRLVTVEGTIVSPDGDLEDKHELSGKVRLDREVSLHESQSGLFSIYLGCSVTGAHHEPSHSLLTGLQCQELSVRLVLPPGHVLLLLLLELNLHMRR